MKRTFASEFLPGVNPETLEFYNVDLDVDIKAGIDPALLETRESELVRIRLPFNRTFDAYRKRLWQAILDNNQPEFIRLILVNESPEVCLGYSKKKQHHGAGMGEVKANRLTNAIWENRTYIMSLSEFSMASIYVKNFGLDTVSDIAVGVIKSELIDFTARICAQYSIPTEEIKVSNIYNSTANTWESRICRLPRNPHDSHQSKNGIILIPRYFIRGQLYIGYAEFSKFAKKVYGKQIIESYKLKIKKDITDIHIRDFAIRFPKIVERFEITQREMLSKKDKKGNFVIKPKEQNL